MPDDSLIVLTRRKRSSRKAEHKRASVSQVGFKERLKLELESLRDNWNQLPEKSKTQPLADDYVRLAFQNAHLDIFKPDDQALFLLALARVLHGRKGLKPPGFYNELARDAEAARKQYDLSGKRAACERLARRTKYREYSAHTLLKLLDKATDRHENPDYEELTKGRPPRKKHDRHVFYKKAIPVKKPKSGKK
jgi:hypothetical protein